MPLDARQLALLQSLVRRDKHLRDEGRAPEFLLLRMPGARVGLKPSIEDEEHLNPTEADLLDLESEGFLHLLPSTSEDVICKLALSSAGREAGSKRSVAADIAGLRPETAPPSLDDVLKWIAGLAASGSGYSTLASGGAVFNEALARWGEEHIEAVARTLLDLRGHGLLLFEDPGAQLQQISDVDRLSMAEHFRLSASGRDRTLPAAQGTTVTQIVHATQAQVAAGDITNYVSFEQLLDHADRELERIEGVDEETRAEARGLLNRLRGPSETIATGAGGALLAGVLKELLGLPSLR